MRDKDFKAEQNKALGVKLKMDNRSWRLLVFTVHNAEAKGLLNAFNHVSSPLSTFNSNAFTILFLGKIKSIT